MPPCPLALPLRVQKRMSRKVAGRRAHWVPPRAKVFELAGCSSPFPDPRELGAAGRATAGSLLFPPLGQPTLISRVEWDSLGRYRMSSPAFAPAAEKQVQMQCTQVSEQLPERQNQTVSKAVGGRAGTPGRGRRGGGPRAGEGRGEGVKGTLSVGDARSSPWGASKVGDARAGRVPGVGIGARGQRVKRPLPVGETLGSLNPWVGWGARKVRPLGRVGSPEWRSRLGEGGGGRGPHPVGSAGRSATLGGLGEEGCLDWSWGCFGPPAGRSRLRAGWGAGKGEARRGGAGGSSLPAARERAPSQPSHAVRERRVVASAQTVPRRRGGFQRAPPPSNHSAAPARGMHLCGAGPRSG